MIKSKDFKSLFATIERCNAVFSVFALCFFTVMSSTVTRAQLVEDLIVETYYITDENDVASASSDGISQGLTTYRLFIDLCPGCRLTQMFGNADHEIRIESTEAFFNASVGAAYGHVLNGALMNLFDAAPLDSYLSFGAASSQHWGVMKPADPNGSIWSARTPPQALTHIDAELGIPLTESDGLISSGGQSTTPNGWILPFNNADVLAVFGNSADTNLFSSQNITFQSSTGALGQNTENRILIAQITTAGALSFEINVEILDTLGERHTIVASDPLGDEILSPFLSFPRECGCTDTDFLEYDPIALCDDGSCATLIVFGCLNEEACNYDPSANFDVPELCCFVDSCQGLDPSLICPTLSSVELLDKNVSVFPNPTADFLYISGLDGPAIHESIYLIDINGRVLRNHVSVVQAAGKYAIDVSDIESGLYILVYQNMRRIESHKIQIAR